MSATKGRRGRSRPTPRAGRGGRSRFELDPEDVRRGLGRLVLTVLDILRELLERQAVRRIAVGDLDDSTIDRLGRALERLRDEAARLKRYFGLRGDADLDLRLGDLLELR